MSHPEHSPSPDRRTPADHQQAARPAIDFGPDRVIFPAATAAELELAQLAQEAAARGDFAHARQLMGIDEQAIADAAQWPVGMVDDGPDMDATFAEVDAYYAARDAERAADLAAIKDEIAAERFTEDVEAAERGADPWADYRVYEHDEAAEHLAARDGVALDDARAAVDRYLDGLSTERGWTPEDGWQIDDDDLAAIATTPSAGPDERAVEIAQEQAEQAVAQARAEAAVDDGQRQSRQSSRAAERRETDRAAEPVAAAEPEVSAETGSP